MKAVVIEKRSLIWNKLELKDVKIPQIKADEVLIKVIAVGVNEHDLQYKKFNGFDGISACPGLECSGIIEAIGENVQGWQIGDKIHNGASAIGIMAIQIAKHKGMEVIATERTDEKMQFCRNIGADFCFDRKRNNIPDLVKGATAERGVDFVIDDGSSPIHLNLACCAVLGKLLIVGSHVVKRKNQSLSILLRRRLQIRVDLEDKGKDYKASIIEKVKQELWPAIEQDRVKPIIYHEMPLGEAARAHKLMKNKKKLGKIVLCNQL